MPYSGATPHSDPTPHSESPPDPIDCLFATILGFTLPFHLVAGGDPSLARVAILELIEAYNPATAAELDLVGRLAGFSAASMDNLRLSMRPGLPDTKVLKYRANAVALGRSAEQCRKGLEAMQTKRELSGETAAMAHPVPVPEPAPIAASPPAAPPQGKPPAQHMPIAHPICAHPGVALEESPEFTGDIAVMQRNARAMLAYAHEKSKHPGPEAAQASIARIASARSPAINPDNAAIA
jgi:hypothetical protein